MLIEYMVGLLLTEAGIFHLWLSASVIVTVVLLTWSSTWILSQTFFRRRKCSGPGKRSLMSSLDSVRRISSVILAAVEYKAQTTPQYLHLVI